MLYANNLALVPLTVTRPFSLPKLSSSTMFTSAPESSWTWSGISSTLTVIVWPLAFFYWIAETRYSSSLSLPLKFSIFLTFCTSLRNGISCRISGILYPMPGKTFCDWNVAIDPHRWSILSVPLHSALFAHYFFLMVHLRVLYYILPDDSFSKLPDFPLL